jgi:hypothetical protein
LDRPSVHIGEPRPSRDELHERGSGDRQLSVST